MDDDFYRLHADYEERNWWFVAKNRIVLSLLERYAPKVEGGGRKQRVCDVGCGAGGLLAKLSKKYEAVGMDMSPIALRYCAERSLDAREGSLPDEVPFAPGTFDAVIATEVLEHVEDDRGGVKAIAGLLRPGGVLICTAPAHEWMWSRHDDLNHHCRRYTKKGFRGIFEGAGLEEVMLSYYNFVLFPLMVGVRVVGKLTGMDGGGAGFKPPLAPVNAAFRMAFQAEGGVLGRVSFPTGGSVISVHRRVSGREVTV